MKTINTSLKAEFVLPFSLQEILAPGGPWWPLAAAPPGALAAHGCPWRSLAAPGCSWRPLAPGATLAGSSLCGPLAAPGGPWWPGYSCQPLAAPGGPWETLAAPGGPGPPWLLQAALGGFWWPLAAPGSPWLLLAPGCSRRLLGARPLARLESCVENLKQRCGKLCGTLKKVAWKSVWNSYGKLRGTCFFVWY